MTAVTPVFKTQINHESWHYKFYQMFRRHFEFDPKEPTELCGYFWTVVALAPLAYVLAGVALGVVWVITGLLYITGLKKFAPKAGAWIKYHYETIGMIVIGLLLLVLLIGLVAAAIANWVQFLIGLGIFVGGVSIAVTLLIATAVGLEMWKASHPKKEISDDEYYEKLEEKVAKELAKAAASRPFWTWLKSRKKKFCPLVEVV